MRYYVYYCEDDHTKPDRFGFWGFDSRRDAEEFIHGRMIREEGAIEEKYATNYTVIHGDEVSVEVRGPVTTRVEIGATGARKAVWKGGRREMGDEEGICPMVPYWKGKPCTTMTKGELIEALKEMKERSLGWKRGSSDKPI